VLAPFELTPVFLLAVGAIIGTIGTERRGFPLEVRGGASLAPGLTSRSLRFESKANLACSGGARHDDIYRAGGEGLL
jgi:hypothetical protein